MEMFTFLRWLLDTTQYCDIDNTYFDMLPDKLQPHIEVLGVYILSWFGC